MSGYLNRLIMRAQSAHESQFLRPSVRSTSPIAEHDQRLGVAGFENIEHGVSLLADVSTDQELGKADGVQAIMTPDITASSDVTVQRKITGSTNNALTPSAPITSNSSPASIPGSSNIPSAKIKANRISRPVFSEGERSEWPTSSSSESGSQPYGRKRDNPMYSAEQQSQLHPILTAPELSGSTIETNMMAAATATGDSPLAVPSPSDSPTREKEKRARFNHSNTRSVLQERQDDLPSLEPSMHSLSDRNGLRFEDAMVLNSDRKESPRIAIGRINVEVVPQTVPEISGATSRSTPMTAASVSVIGPLGGSVSSNLRLSLRQR
jgi:hypothetical protein